MNGMATARPPYTLGSCTPIQQKSSSLGNPTCSTMKLRSGNSDAASSTSATSNASLFKGQMVGPLWTWMFLTPSSTHFSRYLVAEGSESFQPLESPFHSAVYSLTPLRSYLSTSSSNCQSPCSPSRGSKEPLRMNLSGYFSFKTAFCSVVLKPWGKNSVRYVG